MYLFIIYEAVCVICKAYVCVFFCSGYIQGMNIILESEVTLTAALKTETIEEVLIGEGIILQNYVNIHIILQVFLNHHPDLVKYLFVILCWRVKIKVLN